MRTEFLIISVVASIGVACVPRSAGAVLQTPPAGKTLVEIDPVINDGSHAATGPGTTQLTFYANDTHTTKIRITANKKIIGSNLYAGHGCVGKGTVAEPIQCWWERYTYRNADGTFRLNVSLQGGNDNVRIDASDVSSFVYLGGGRNVFTGGPGNDVVYGGSGKDRLDGRGGDDQLHGLGDADKLYGREGNDTLYGDDGNDVLSGGIGNDKIAGGLDDDTINGGDGNDVISGGSGKDSVLGEAGDDTVSGDTGADTFDATSPNDVFDFSYRPLPPGVSCQRYFTWWTYKTDEGDVINPANLGVFRSRYGDFAPPVCA